MKRFFVASIVACVLFAGCSPLRIVLNTKSPDGERTVLTSNELLFNYGFNSIEAALGARISQKDTVLAIMLTSNQDTDHGIFDENDRLLIRFADQSVITLVNVYDREYKTETTTGETQERVSMTGYDYVYSPWADAVFLAPYEVSAFVPRTYVRKTTNSYALYLVTKQQLLDIIGKQIIKLRVEIENDDLDMANPGGASAVFKDLYDFLNENISKQHERKAF